MKKLGATTIVECPPALQSLLRACPGVDQLITSSGSALPDFDVHAPLMSIPAILGTTLELIPVDIPYLHAEPQLRERWRQKLSEHSGTKDRSLLARKPESRLRSVAFDSAPAI